MQLVVVLLALVCSLFWSSRARASASPEDGLADGDLDAEDVASARPFAPVTVPFGGASVLPAAHDSTWITLGGFTRETGDGRREERREVGAFVVLGIPLDRLARGSRATTGAPALVLASTQTPAPATEVPFELMLTPRLARACVDAAWRAAGFSGDENALDAIVSRAHWSAALPEARLRVLRYDDTSLALYTGDTTNLRDSAGANLGFEARLTWRLDRLVYADDEPAFERIRLEHRDARGRIAAKVLEALFHWQRAMLDLRTLPPSQVGTRDEADVVLRVMEAEAALDVLTDGWFAAHKQDATRTGKSVNASRRNLGSVSGL